MQSVLKTDSLSYWGHHDFISLYEQHPTQQFNKHFYDYSIITLSIWKKVIATAKSQK